MKRSLSGRALLLLALAVVAAALQGCSYLGNRGRDAAEMFDLGFTFSRKPQLGLYMNCPMVVPIGYGKVDAQFVGVGGGKVGVMEHREKSLGLLFYGREEVSWGEDEDGSEASSHYQPVGVLGLAEAREDEQPYKPACIHYLHLGWIGVTFNIRWQEIFDFLVGVVGFDPSRDDVGAAGRLSAEDQTALEL
jgi:hypothetical protein